MKRKKRGARTTFSASDAIPPTDPGERQHIDIKLYNAPTIYGFRCLLRSICRVTEMRVHVPMKKNKTTVHAMLHVLAFWHAHDGHDS